MSKLQALRALIGQRLTAVAEEIFGAVERTIAEYEEEVSSSLHQQDRYRKLMDNVLIPQIKLKRIDSQQFTVPESIEEHPPDLERSPSLDQEGPEPTQMKEEQEELWTSQEGEQREEAKVLKVTLNCTVKGFLNLDPTRTDGRTGSFSRTSADQKTTKPDGEGCSVPEPATEPDRSHGLLSTEAAGCGPLSTEAPGCGLLSTEAPGCGLLSTEAPGCGPLSTEATGCGSGGGLSHVPGQESHRLRHCKERLGCRGKAFEQPALLRHHMNTHGKPFKCPAPACSKRFSHQGDLYIHISEHQDSYDKAFKSSLCRKGFSGVSGLNSHMLTHRKERWIDSSDCWTGVNHKGNYKMQMTSFHERRASGAGWNCDPNLKINVASQPQDHCKVTRPHCSQAPCSTASASPPSGHRPERLFHCSFCERTFNQSGNLKHHLMIHTGEKPHKCHMCTRGFTKRADLARHIRSHMGEKPFACSVCHKLFARKENVRKHMRQIHSEVVLTTVV